MPTTKSSPHRLAIIGGSLAGLMAGNLFHRIGWDVHIFERTDGILEGRGAGITILPGLIETFSACGVPEQAYGIMLPERIALDRAGNIVAQRSFAQEMTSWRRLFEMLKAAFPSERYHGGVTLERIEQNAEKVTALFTNGQHIDADLLVGADGLRSGIRSQFLPEARPYYPGYIAWRCLADETALSTATHEQLFGRYTVCVTPGQQGIGYPVPGPDHSIAIGKRQYNVVWYQPIREGEELRRLLTDDTGRYHPNGIPPALIGARVRAEMVDAAQEVLAPQFAEAIRRARLYFFQPIYDLELSRLVFGRVVLVGDAAFITRPHVAMGVPKAGGDVLALLEACKRGGDDYMTQLPAFEAERLRVSTAIVRRGKYLGSYMEAQLKPDEERLRAERQRVPEQVMMETAAPMNYD